MKKLECEDCGGALDWDGEYGKAVECPYCGSRFLPSPTEVDDVWLMSDPVALAGYQFEDTLDRLEHDIRYEVLRGGTWSELDRAYLREIERLEKAGLVRRLASFWATSPHPPIYRALADGELVIGGRRYQFRKGQEIAWACPMTRDLFDLESPMLIGDFQSARVKQLCGEMSNAMMSRMAR
jgi:DNA-directed RNA polymerase subunit RPC12/RpoP